MKQDRKSRRILDRFLMMGIMLSAAFWLAESLIHAYMFRESTFLAQFATTEPNELWMRALVVAMLVSFSVYAASVVSRLRRSREALMESEERYCRIVETAEEGVCMLDSGDRISFANRRFAEMLGYDAQELAGRPLLSLADAEGGKPLAASLARHHSGEKERGDFRMKRSDGVDIWLSVSAAPMYGAVGEYEGSLAMVSDITGRKMAEKALSDRLDELERFRRATVERELRIKELKDRLGALQA